MTITVNDRTPRFLAFYEAAVSERDPNRRWELWKEHTRFLPFGDTPEAEAEARKHFDVAWRQYAGALPRIRKRGSVTEQHYKRVIEAAVALVQLPDVAVTINFGVGFVMPLSFARATQQEIIIFYAVDYPYEDPEKEFAFLICLALYHFKIGRESRVDAYDLAEHAMLHGIAAHALQRVLPGRPLSAYLSENDTWVLQCAVRSRELVHDFLDALDLPPHKGLLRGFFWECDYLEPERPGAWVAYLALARLLQTYSLQELYSVGPDRWTDLVRTACTQLLQELGSPYPGAPPTPTASPEWGNAAP